MFCVISRTFHVHQGMSANFVQHCHTIFSLPVLQRCSTQAWQSKTEFSFSFPRPLTCQPSPSSPPPRTCANAIWTINPQSSAANTNGMNWIDFPFNNVFQYNGYVTHYYWACPIPTHHQVYTKVKSEPHQKYAKKGTTNTPASKEKMRNKSTPFVKNHGTKQTKALLEVCRGPKSQERERPRTCT